MLGGRITSAISSFSGSRSLELDKQSIKMHVSMVHRTSIRCFFPLIIAIVIMAILYGPCPTEALEHNDMYTTIQNGTLFGGRKSSGDTVFERMKSRCKNRMVLQKKKNLSLTQCEAACAANSGMYC